MTPTLLIPAALAALAALLAPIVIHIARRTESRTVDFAALRWLEARPAPRRRLRVDERWLLAVRLLLLAAIALWLARPVAWGVEDTRRVVAIAPGLDGGPLAARDDRLVWLAPGFPAVRDGPPAASAGLVSLIRQLDAELPPSTPLTLVVPAVLESVDAERPRLSRQVTWRVLPQAPAPQPARPAPPPALVVRYAPGAQDGVRYFRAAAIAWTEPDAAPAFEAAPADQPIDATARHLVWLAPGPLPDPVAAWIRTGGVALLAHDVRQPLEAETGVAWRDPVGAPLAVSSRLGDGRVIRLTQPLAPAAVPQLVEPDFPDALARMLAPAPPPARVAAADHSPLAGAAAYGQPPYELRPWLALVIGLIFLAERWLATRSRRSPAP